MIIPNSLPHVVSLGGGTGLACLLKGLKHRVLDPPVVEPTPFQVWFSRITAIVTVTDDGGSSGRLREELQVLPPGDIRNCLVALSSDESLMSRLFQYRFTSSGHLHGHSFGNLFLTALTGITGDFLEAIRVTSDVLAIKGRIYPSTLEDVTLEAQLADGTRLIGESAISATPERIVKVTLLPRSCGPVPAVLEAIRDADIITIGPGSLFTSLIPNLLVRGLAREIRRSRALKLYICNLMTQPGETAGFTAADHLKAITEHAGPNLFDGVVLNNSPMNPDVLSRYRAQGAECVEADPDFFRSQRLEVFQGNLLAHGSAARHDPALLAEAVHKAYTTWSARDETHANEATFSS